MISCCHVNLAPSNRRKNANSLHCQVRKTMRDIGVFLNQLIHWVESRPDITATLLVGSFARGTAHEDSDVDVVLITQMPQWYLGDHHWLDLFGEVLKVENEDWGLVQSKRVFYRH